MSEENLFAINGFLSYKNFEEFLSYIETLKFNKKIIEIPVEEYYWESNVRTEKWFLNLSDNSKWRFVYPDYPFKGIVQKMN
jgi:hypothetical protein